MTSAEPTSSDTAEQSAPARSDTGSSSSAGTGASSDAGTGTDASSADRADTSEYLSPSVLLSEHGVTLRGGGDGGQRARAFTLPPPGATGGDNLDVGALRVEVWRKDEMGRLNSGEHVGENNYRFKTLPAELHALASSASATTLAPASVSAAQRWLYVQPERRGPCTDSEGSKEGHGGADVELSGGPDAR